MRWTTIILFAVLLLCPHSECEAARSLVPVSVDKVLNVSVAAYSDAENEKKLNDFIQEKSRVERRKKVWTAITQQVYGLLLFAWLILSVILLLMAIKRRVPIMSPIIIGVGSIIGLFFNLVYGGCSLFWTIFLPVCVVAPIQYGLLFLQNEKTRDKIGKILSNMPRIAAYTASAMCLLCHFLLKVNPSFIVGILVAAIAFPINLALSWLAIYRKDMEAYICQHCGYFAKHKWKDSQQISADVREKVEEEELRGRTQWELAYAHSIAKRKVKTRSYSFSYVESYECVHCGKTFTYVKEDSGVNTEYGDWKKS